MLTRLIRIQLVLFAAVRGHSRWLSCAGTSCEYPVLSASVDTRSMPNCRNPGACIEPPTSPIGGSPSGRSPTSNQPNGARERRSASTTATRSRTDASANVHSVSAVGEQYLDLVSTRTGGPYLRNNQTITKSTVPSQIGPALDAANRALAVLPKEKVGALLHEASLALGGLGPSLRAPGRRRPGDRSRLQGQHRRHRRDSRSCGAHHRQPGQFR